MELFGQGACMVVPYAVGGKTDSNASIALLVA